MSQEQSQKGAEPARPRVEGSTLEQRVFGVLGAALLLSALGYLMWRVLSPLWHSIAWAVMLGVLMTPFNNRLAARLGGRRSLASVLSLVVLVLFVLLPLVIFSAELALQASHLQGLLPEHLPDATGRFLFEYEWLESLLRRVAAATPMSLEQVHSWTLSGFRHVLAQLRDTSGIAVQGAFGALVHFLLMLFVLFFVLRDGPSVGRAAVSLLPIEARRRERLRRNVVATTRAVFMSIGVAALVHGVLIGVGCWIAGLPAPLVLGLLAAMLALVPVVGSALVWVPATLFLLAQGQQGHAVFLAAWSVLLVGAVDHVLRPMLISGHANVPILAIFLGVMGGLAAFGLIGLFIGPIVLGLAVALYRVEIETRSEDAG